jgi:putative ABC transport system permease protein
MTPIVVIAWRNVCRNRRRTSITVTIIGASLTSLLCMWAFIAGSNAQAVDSSTMYLTGHLEIASKSFFDQHGSGRPIRDPEAITRVLARTPDITAFAPRFDSHALISAGGETLPIGVVAVDPVADASVSRLRLAVTTGRYLNAADTRAVVLSHIVARQLHVTPGATITLLGSAPDGGVAIGSFDVVGLFSTANHDIDRAYCVTTLAAARRVYRAGNAVTTFVATTARSRRLPETARELRAALDAEVDVRTWDALLPDVAQSVAFHEALSYMILAIVILLVAIGVSNTLLVSVLERTPEWGALLALGARPAQLVELVVLEGVLLGAIGIPFGLVSALIPIQYFSHHGIDLSQISEGLAALPAHAVTVYPSVTGIAVLVSAVIVMIVSLLAAVYPAAKVARLDPIEAMRHVKRLQATSHRRRGSFASNRFLILNIAIRNLLRHRGRAALVASASAIGVLAMLVMYALIDGFFQQIVDNSTRYFTTDVQIGPTDFASRDPSLRTLIAQPAAVETRVRSTGIGFDAAERLVVPALVTTRLTSRTILVMGIEPAREARVTELKRAVRAGAYLADHDRTGILLGRALADSVHAQVGDAVTLSGRSASAEPVAVAFHVRGLIETGSKAFDDTLALVTLDAAQAMFSVGDQVTVVALRLTDRRQLRALVAALAPSLGERGLEAVPWDSLLPEAGQILEMARAVFGIVLFISFSIAAAGNMNTVLMSIMERKREIGTLLALGTSPARVVRLVVYESFAVVVGGASTGLILGAALIWYLGRHGVDLSAYARSFDRIPGITSVLYPTLIGSHAALVIAGLLGVNLLTSTYPAWVAARLNPVENLHQ